MDPSALHPLAGRAFSAPRMAVAAPDRLAAAAGFWALARGGVAVDAAVAMNAALGVVYPHMSGPGGDAFWLVYDPSARRCHALNASGRAAAAATRERYAALGERIDPRGPLAALTVPGAVDGWVQAHRRFGRLRLSECLEPAIALARDGFPVSRGLARWSAASVELLRRSPDTAAVFLTPDGGARREGETMRNPRLARTLEAVAAGGREAFYEGAVGRAVAEHLTAAGGVLTADDFAAHRSEWVEPAAVRYRGRTAVTTPPNSQGVVHSEMLGMLDRFDVAGLRDDPAAYVDLLVGATRLAFADRDEHVTDPGFGAADTPLSGARLAAQARRLAARDLPPTGSACPGGDTTFVCAVDAEGGVAGVIQSIYFEWGSGVVAGETGLLLQNRGSAFSLDERHPNRLEPGKRPFHTLMAGMLLGPSGSPELVYGAMGGDGQPQTATALVTRIVDHGMGVQAAVDAPRWLWGRTWGAPHLGLRLEGRFGRDVAGALGGRGHAGVEVVEAWSDLMGHAQAIAVFPDHVEAAVDPRSDGAAMGL